MCKIFWKDYTRWALCYLLVMCLFMGLYYILGFYKIEHVDVFSDELPTVIGVIRNNTFHFLQHIILFPLSPILILRDIFLITTEIFISAEISGVGKTIMLLVPHGLVEMPNIMLYSFIGFRMANVLWKERRLSAVIKQIQIYRYNIVISYGLLIIAAVLEGVNL
ncbi:hypothetical protein AMBR_FBHANALA_01581 [Dolosigranulum pigrum]|nr:hypothetical protein AMBR_FBHANALA_01581 [Dolosigranulum pigrum]